MLISNFHVITAAAAIHTSLASAQNLEEKVWAVVAYNLYGDSIPSALPRPKALTPYGANELYAAGSVFRDRYVAIHDNNNTSNTRIQNLSPYLIDAEEVDVFSTTDPSVVASAQAFMQGLYPPLEKSLNATFSDSPFQLANGSIATAPLGGYQYPQIVTLDAMDPRSIKLDGDTGCLLHQVADTEYKYSPEAQEITQDSAAFYSKIYPFSLSGVLDPSSANYANAVMISEYLDYESVHNESLLHNVNQDDIDRARSLADRYVFATNGYMDSTGTNVSDRIRTVAGRTLASSILDAFNNNIDYRGTNGKIALLFGNDEPAVALASLMQLASPKYENFYGRPTRGASMVFELYSLENNSSPAYPDPSQLYVRFLLRNGTHSADFQSYPLFGHGPSNIAIPFTEFQAEMEEVSLGSTKEWCLLCNSQATFCSDVFDGHQNRPTSDKGLSPAVGGVIGAVVTLVVIALISILGFLVCGFRMNRTRRSSLGGFKGNSKMASDSDVTFKNPTWEDVKPADTKETHSSGAGITVLVNRSRTVSNISHQTEASLNRLHCPIRVPKDPPRSSRAQTDAGFARFLKDHTSPKHQRVTAGGRIVPMEPQTPAPKFKLPMQKKEASDHEMEALGSIMRIESESLSGNIPIGSMETNSNRSDISRNSVSPTGILPDLAKLSLTNGIFDQTSQGSGCPPIVPWPAPGYALPSGYSVAFNNQQLPRVDQYPQMAYVPVFPDQAMYGVGSDMHSGIPDMYPSLNVQGPMSSMPTSGQPHLAVSTASSDFTSCSNAASAGSSSAFSQSQLSYEPGYPTFAPQVYQSVGSQFPAPKQPQYLPPMSQGMPHLKCLDEAKKQYESLSSQLSRLDRYMAIHTWDIDSRSKKVMVEQRKSLVRELDVVRMYREQLELIFGKPSMNGSSDQQRVNADLLVPPITYLTGSMADYQGFLGPVSSSSSASCAGQALPTYLTPPTLPMLYPESEASIPVFPWQNLGNPGSAVGVKDMSANGTLGNLNLSQQNDETRTNLNINQRDKQIHTSTFSDESGSTGDEQASSRLPSPSDLQHLYHKIEEATERGEPVGRLLKELSVVTTQLVKQKREEGRISHRSTRGKQNLPPLPSGKPDSTRMTTNGRPMKPASHLWGSEAHFREAVRSCGDTSSTSDNEANGKLSSSCVSTTDSWATVHERSKRLVSMGSLEDPKCGRNPETIWESPRSLPKYKIMSAEIHASGAPHNVGWIQGRLEDRKEVKPSKNTTLHRTHRARGGDSGMQDVKLPISSLNTQLLSRNRGLVFQKTAALAVPQNVNVQAYVPSFDGPGDAPRNETGQRTMETGDRQTQETACYDSVQEARPWYMPKQRPKPSRETLRDFFRQVRDEERREMRDSHNEGQSNDR
ncbi:histidine acid phosphatase [Aspergillus oryzae]|uniref:Histidine acid phosphatase n=1 Tax=Aspergillus oryzae TaxID=5062 RepID=A0A1S9E041_ASPOZ|nr:histidine acid phosphatase [Aspergillus oryzae]